METKTNNQILAEWMGLCWHESVNGLDCYKCKNGHPSFPADLTHPQYDSPHTARKVLDEIVAKIADDPKLRDGFVDALYGELSRFDDVIVLHALSLTPDQIVRAVVACIQGEQNDNT